jgi:hypothetical protein
VGISKGMHMDMGCPDPWARVHKLMDDTLLRQVSLFSSTCNAFTGPSVSFTNLMRCTNGVGHLIVSIGCLNHVL